ncbi:hypothetical protein MRBLMS1_000380 [Massilia sp. LMS1-1-1.1]
MKLIYTTSDKQLVTLNVRAVPGVRPDGMAPVYEILDQVGKPTTMGLDLTIDKHRHIGFYDCVLVEDDSVFAFRWLTKERVVKIGVLTN